LREIDNAAVKAAQSEQALTSFLTEYESWILKCASRTSKRYLTKSDDEWSVALEAFCSAVAAYSYEKGAFLSFAELMIQRRLVDYFRVQNKHRFEFPVSPAVFSGEPEEEGEEVFLHRKIAAGTTHPRDNSLKDEIEAAGAQFAGYGFSFFDLASCSPKSKKTRAACARAISYMLSSPLLCAELRRCKNLPLKLIEQNAGVPRKILERHRKYIIAAIEILRGDYPGLAEYLRPITKAKEETDK